MHDQPSKSVLEVFTRHEIVVERLDTWAHTAGERPFFYYGDGDVTLTFRQFGDITDAIAGNLARLGITKGDRVSLLLFNPLAASLCMFGIWKAGAVFCPINFSFTGRLLAYQLNDTQPRLLITEPQMVERLNQIAGEFNAIPPIVMYAAPETEPLSDVFDSISWAELTQPAARPDVQLAPYDVANIVYTSGTTGPSKGVVQTYRWMNQYTFMLQQFTTQDDVIYSDLPLYHVAGAFANVARAAWVGCQVAVWNRFSPGEFWHRIKHSGASYAILLDVMIPWLLKAPEQPEDRLNTLNKVHMQPLPLQHQSVAQRFGFDIVTCSFGQTEAGVPMCAVIEEVEPGQGTPAGLFKGLSRTEFRDHCAQFDVPVLPGEAVTQKGFMGKPLPYHQVTVLNEWDEPCAPDEVGQLAVRSPLPWMYLTEYLGKPEATIAAFRNLWFHTGDAARYDADGNFYFVDRLGDRMRRRGENLSTFTVEDLLSQHPDIELVAVFPIPSQEGNEDDIVAFVVVKSGCDVTIEILHDWSARELPKFTRPQHIRIVPELPRTPTNKVEKYKLRELILRELGDNTPDIIFNS